MWENDHLTNQNGYRNPLPVIIDTDLFMNKFVDIHGSDIHSFGSFLSEIN